MDSARANQCTARYRRSIGDDEVEFILSAPVATGETDIEFSRMADHLVNAMNRFMDNQATMMKPYVSSSGSQSTADNWFKVNKLSVTRTNGKRYVNAHFGRYQKHGVAVWPELWTEHGKSPDNVPDGGIEPKTMWAHVVQEENKPIRIDRLRFDSDKGQSE